MTPPRVMTLTPNANVSTILLIIRRCKDLQLFISLSTNKRTYNLTSFYPGQDCLKFNEDEKGRRTCESRQV